MLPLPKQSRARSGVSPTSSRNSSHSNHERHTFGATGRTEQQSAWEEMALEGGTSLDEPGPHTQDQMKQLKNLNSIQFFVKGSIILVGSRVSLPPAKQKDSEEVRLNKWFNLVLPESDALNEHIVEWRNLEVAQKRPPPMVIEIYLDIAELSRSQKLVLLDDEGKRWDVLEALNPASAGSRPSTGATLSTEVLLERWEISLDGKPSNAAVEVGTLSAVYKRGIPLFRSLFTYGRTMPAYKYGRRVLKQPPSQPTARLNYRVYNGDYKSTRRDTLKTPLATGDDQVIEKYAFEPLQCSAGTLNISVEYRSNCDFRVDDAESLMSSHFMASDDHYFRPSLAARHKATAQVPSSVPNARYEQTYAQAEGQVYGSLGTFHRPGAAPGTSPLSAIRAIRDDPRASPDTPPSARMPPEYRRAASSRSSTRSETAPIAARRPSVSFQPFKAGSLASSPSINVPPSPGTSFSSRAGPSSLNHARNRPSLTTLPQQVLRTPNLPQETAIASSASSSPKPAPITRYSSSFSHRRSRLSSAGSKGEEDQSSSGKHSASSSAQPGSDLINESQRGNSSGSMELEDDKNLQDFIHLLEAKKELPSFSRIDPASRDATMRRTTAQLSKYRGMRESNTVLSDSLSSSLLLHKSSSSSSRQLSSIPPMIHGTSVSTASSPGKPISPHTPHTPAVPSRLSDNLTIDYGATAHRSRSQRRSQASAPREDDSSEGTAREGTNAIDIPTSPRAWPYGRRSSSASGQHRDRGLADEPDLYGMRSSSLPTDGAAELSMSELLRVNEGHDPPSPSASDRSPGPDSSNYPAYPFPSLDSRPDSREGSGSRPNSMGLAEAVQPLLRHRIGRGFGCRRGSPSFSSERGSRHSVGSRASANTNAGEEDELIFHFSELNSASRRSLEENRGPSSSARGERRGG